MTNPRKILIVKLGAVGDCLHTLIAAAELRRLAPETVIGWLVETKSRQIVEGHPLLDRVHIWNRKAAAAALKSGKLGPAWNETKRVIDEVRAEGYDTAIDFQNLLKSGFFAWRSGAPRRIGFDRLREGNFLFTNRRVKPGEDETHMVRRYLALLRPLGVEPQPNPPAVAIPVAAGDKQAVDEFFKNHIPAGKPVVAINPAASLPHKLWPADRFAAVADRLVETHHIVPLLIWGPGEEPLVAAVRQAMRFEAQLAPATTIRELAHLLSRCTMYLGNDSGPMHLAAAMGAAVVGLFGPTDPRRVAPWTPRGRAVEPFEPFHKRRAVDGVTVDQVTAAAAELLEKA